MSYRLPSLNGLRAFEASARHLSFKHAANELCVTPGAISQQVKALEDSIGVKLFHRLPSGLLLTATGEKYLQPVSEAFEKISVATDEISTLLKGRAFRLGIAASLAKHLSTTLDQFCTKTLNAPAILVSETEGTEKLLSGQLDALFRERIKSHPRLHLDNLTCTLSNGSRQEMTLAVIPGTAGCREHSLLLEVLSNLEQ